MKKKRAVVAALLACLFLTLPGIAQRGQRGQRGQRESARVDYVLIDVVAVGKKKKLITDLTREDFTVTENKRAVQIESFDILDMRTSDAAQSDDEPQQSEARFAIRLMPQYLIVIDLEFARMPDVHRTFTLLDDFFRGPELPVGVYQLISLEDGALTDEFDSDKATVLHALGNYRSKYLERFRGSRGVTSDGGFATLGSADLAALENRFEQCRFPAEIDSRNALRMQACIMQELRLYLDLLFVRTERVLEELGYLTERFEDQTRPNTVLFVSPGFSLRPGVAASRLAEVYMDLGRSPGEERMARGNPFSSVGRPNRNYEDRFRRIVHDALARRVVFHTFDVYNFNLQDSRRSSVEFSTASSAVVGAYREQAAEFEEGMTALARESGGYFHSGPRLGKMNSIGDRTSFVYTIGYTTPPGGGDFRRIRIKCKRKGVKLFHRIGYFPG